MYAPVLYLIREWFLWTNSPKEFLSAPSPEIPKILWSSSLRILSSVSLIFRMLWAMLPSHATITKSPPYKPKIESILI